MAFNTIGMPNNSRISAKTYKNILRISAKCLYLHSYKMTGK